MKIYIISWKVSGHNDPEKRGVVNGSVSMWRPDVLCLQKTKISSMNNEVARSVWEGRWVKCSLDSPGG